MSDEIERVVLGEQRYTVSRYWGTLPDGVKPGLVSTLAVAADGSVYVAQRGGGAPVIIFDVDGQYRGAWARDGITDPHGINIDGADRVLLVDRDAHEVQIRDLDGALLMTLGARNYPSHQQPFNHPTSAFVAPDGEIYVADGYGNSAVHRFASDGTLMNSWGESGTGIGEFSTPHSIWVDKRDQVLIADRENNRICVFHRDGAYITSWLGFYHPMDIAEDPHGNIYVSDQTPRVTRISPDGTTQSRCRPAWNVPHGLACSPDGAIFIAEMNPSSITTIRPC